VGRGTVRGLKTVCEFDAFTRHPELLQPLPLRHAFRGGEVEDNVSMYCHGVPLPVSHGRVTWMATSCVPTAMTISVDSVLWIVSAAMMLSMSSESTTAPSTRSSPPVWLVNHVGATAATFAEMATVAPAWLNLELLSHTTALEQLWHRITAERIGTTSAVVHHGLPAFILKARLSAKSPLTSYGSTIGAPIVPVAVV
jgi:hypothetical protein